MSTHPNPLPTPIAWNDAARRSRFDHWLARITPRHGLRGETLRPASTDASFRRYLRIDAAAGSLIVMDAPPPQEDVRPFVDVAQRIASAGLHAPQVLESDCEDGFLLLSDLGSALYLDLLQDAVNSGNSASADRLMRDAVATLVTWQQRVDGAGLPAYDEALLKRELALFPEWCVVRELGARWTTDEQAQWHTAAAALVHSALAQPTVTVHRDYMPRNLMRCSGFIGNGDGSGDGGGGGNGDRVGILDFQDAVRGPISYDIASLLRDAFISWDEDQEIDWAARYWQQAKKVGLPVPADFGEFWRQLEWMGLQRHLKVLGIFCRLKHRDGKPKYSQDLPRFFAYAHKVASRYNALRPLSRLLEPLMGAERRDVYY